MPEYTALSEIKKLFDFKEVSANKIYTIKVLRSISGEGLKETKDFLDQVMIPALQHQNPLQTRKPDAGVAHPPNRHIGVPLVPPMYLVGHSYKQRDKNTVLILGVSNFNTEGETVYSMDETGNVIHRYNRRDFGRVIGSDYNNLDPRNLELLP